MDSLWLMQMYIQKWLKWKQHFLITIYNFVLLQHQHLLSLIMQKYINLYKKSWETLRTCVDIFSMFAAGNTSKKKEELFCR